MFFTLLLIYFCEKIVISNKNKDWVFFSLFCILGVGFDHSILFIVPAVFAVLLLNVPFKYYWKRIVYSGIFVFTFSFLFFYFCILNQISNSIRFIQKYWLSFYPNLSSVSSFFNWFISSFKKMFYYFDLPFFPVSLLIILLGLSLFYKKSKKRYLIYIIFPLLLALIASFLKRYPFGGSRLMLFFAPLLYFAFGNGIGIGEGFTAFALPHHRAYGSVHGGSYHLR